MEQRFVAVLIILLALFVSTQWSTLSTAGAIPSFVIRGHSFPDVPQKIAVIGDFGCNATGCYAQKVSQLVQSFSPDIVVSTGDDNYPAGDESTICANLQPYKAYILSTHAVCPSTPAGGINKFYSVLGNHDYSCSGPPSCWGNPHPYLNYFSFPLNASYPAMNERVYDFTQGKARFYMMNTNYFSDPSTPLTTQKAWLSSQLSSSTSTWNFLVGHSAAYSTGTPSGTYTGDPALETFFLPGLDAYLTGHFHGYERTVRPGKPLEITIGSSGASLNVFKSTPAPYVQFKDHTHYGFLLITLQKNAQGKQEAVFEYWTLNSNSADGKPYVLLDTHTLTKP